MLQIATMDDQDIVCIHALQVVAGAGVYNGCIVGLQAFGFVLGRIGIQLKWGTIYGFDDSDSISMVTVDNGEPLG